jgi:MFS family permease
VIRTIREVLRLADVRRVEMGWGLAVTGELAGTVTLVAYSYAAGGAVLVAAYTAARTVAGMFVAFSLGGLADRFRREQLLRWFTAARAALLALAALAAALHGPAAVVIALAAASSSLQGTYRPTMSMLLPWLVRTPAELASANVMAAVLENLAGLAGPVLAGALLAFASSWAAMACAALALGLAGLSVRRLTVPARHAPASRRARHMVRDAVTGVAELARVASPAGVMILIFAQMFVRGALTVLIAVLAVKTLLLGPSAVGWLNAAIGAGGVAGGALAGAVVRLTRLGRSFVTGVLLWACRSWCWPSRPVPRWPTSRSSWWGWATRWRAWECSR